MLHAMPLLLLVMLFTRNRQRLGDMMARTVVVEGQQVSPRQGPDEQGGGHGPDDAADT